MHKIKHYAVPILLFLTFASAVVAVIIQRGYLSYDTADDSESNFSSLKLYWFIPDGFRADPALFNIYKWAEQGILPNIKRMMERGVYGYSLPVFPGHTPTNFATLLTGVNADVHGVADGPMHIEGHPLKVVSKSGFSSIAKKVPPIWFNLERTGNHVTLLSVPGSTPPELSRGTTIRGRWGGWGVDMPAVIFHSGTDKSLQIEQGRQRRVFEFGPELTRYVKSIDPSGWKLVVPKSYSDPREVALKNWGSTVYAYVFDATDDGIANYDRVLLSQDKETIMTVIGPGEWSDWHDLSLSYQLSNDYNVHTPKKSQIENELSAITLEVATRFHIIRLGSKDEFRIRLIYDSLNSHSVKPSILAGEIKNEVGPMVDFVDNFPPQLIYFADDKRTFMQEARQSLNWHRRAAESLINSNSSDIIIHDIYTPNQMLTSRWWMGYIDPVSLRFNDVDSQQREKLFDQVLEMYRGIDKIVGTILDAMDENTVFVLSSDHGVVPLNTEVRLNNILADHGLLRYKFDDRSGEYSILWEQTRAVFLKMDGVYINPEGLGGNFKRASGDAYEALRKRVRKILLDLRDGNNRPLQAMINWEDADSWNLPKDRVGDLIIANTPGYGWVEEITADKEYFGESLTSGYKQAIQPDGNPGMLTPFVVVGPGVKKDFALNKVIRHIDQYPTLMELLGEPIPGFVQGQVVKEVFR